METLEIEDLKILLSLVDAELCFNNRDYISLNKISAVIEQLIKDKEFERDQTTLNKL